MSIPFHRPMLERDREQEGRASTPLEAFFDLTVVVAVAACAAAMRTNFVAGDVGGGIVGFLSVFFGIWWAWVNFTWFASAFDTDDVPFRFMTMIQMGGVLVLAAGVPSAADGDFRVVTLGYVIMRVALVAQWIRAERESGDPEGVCRRYWHGILVVQLLWVGRLLLPTDRPALAWMAFAVLVLGELLVPVYAERGTSGSPWHAGHIAERYGLFVIITCGEVILSASNSFAAAIVDGLSLQIVLVGVGALLIVFSMWWTYFQRDISRELCERGPWRWAYLHYAVFASVAAAGAGIGVMVDLATADAHLPLLGGDLLLAGAVAAYLIAVGLAHHALTGHRHELAISCLIAALVLVVGVLGREPGTTSMAIAGVLVLTIAANVAYQSRRRSGDAAVGG